MRSMSFMLTTDQIRSRTKTVTRRTGWANLKPGTLLRAVVKGMGLRKGERMEPLAIIQVVDVCRPILSGIDPADVVREGFQGMSREEFMEMFCESRKGCTPNTVVTCIEFKYVPGGRLE